MGCSANNAVAIGVLCVPRKLNAKDLLLLVALLKLFLSLVYITCLCPVRKITIPTAYQLFPGRLSTLSGMAFS